MTPECSIKVSSPADLLATIPYLLGFHPADSLVVLAFRGRTVVFAARQDLPPVDLSAEDVRDVATYFAEIVLHQDMDSVVLVGYGEPDQVTPAVVRLGQALREAEVPVADELRVTDGRFWSYRCDSPECCPPEGRPYRPDDSVVAAVATFAGQVALPDRAALVAQIEPVTGEERAAMADATSRAYRRLGDLLTAETHDVGQSRQLRKAGRAAVRDAERRYRSGRRLDDDEMAWLGLLLVDIPVRDYAWGRSGIEDWCVELWTDVVRRVDRGYVPAPACLLGFTAFKQGHGPLALVAVDRALEVEPTYSMAGLLARILSSGIPPSAFLDQSPHGRPAAGRGSRRARRGKSGDHLAAGGGTTGKSIPQGRTPGGRNRRGARRAL